MSSQGNAPIGASIIDIEVFRRDRSIPAATIPQDVATKRFRVGDKVVDNATGEVGAIIRAPEDPRSRFIVSFPRCRRPLTRDQLELWQDDAVLPCDVEPVAVQP